MRLNGSILVLGVAIIVVSLGCASDNSRGDESAGRAMSEKDVAAAVNATLGAAEDGDVLTYCDSLAPGARTILRKIAASAARADVESCEASFVQLNLDEQDFARASRTDVTLTGSKKAVVREPGDTGNQIQVVARRSGLKLQYPFYMGR